MNGSLVSHYRLEEKLGAGTYGVVYRAVHLHDQQLEVAIKVVHPALAGDAAFVRSLREECRLLSRLQHGNIVGFRDLVLTDLHPPALVLELLRGRDLRQRLLEGPVAIGEAEDVLRQLLDALAFAHHNGVVHRDVKPSNVFVCEDGTVKLLDFGIARSADRSRATQTGTLFGTLDYMAPELFDGAPADARSDIYAAGLVWWELLAGRPACPDAPPARKVGWHVGVGAPDVRAHRSTCPPHVVEAITAMTSRTPADRPQTAGEARRLLGTPQQHPAEALTPRDRPGPPAREAPSTVAPRRRQPEREPNPLPTPPPPGPAQPRIANRRPLLLAGIGAVGIALVASCAVGAMLLLGPLRGEGASAIETEAKRDEPLTGSVHQTVHRISASPWADVFCGILGQDTGAFTGAVGRISCWGGDPGYALPTGSFAQVDLAWWHGCAVKSDGNATCFGRYSSGDPVTGVTFPPGRYTAVSAEGWAIDASGNVVGSSGWAQHQPQQPPRDRRALALLRGEGPCAVYEDGGIACGWYRVDLWRRDQVPDGPWREVAFGMYHAMGVRPDGTTVTWSDEAKRDPGPLPEPVVTATSGLDFSCGLTEDGLAVCSGNNYAGKTSPPQDLRFVDIAAVSQSACGVTNAGKLACWGGLIERFLPADLLAPGRRPHPEQYGQLTIDNDRQVFIKVDGQPVGEPPIRGLYLEQGTHEVSSSWLKGGRSTPDPDPVTVVITAGRLVVLDYPQR